MTRHERSWTFVPERMDCAAVRRAMGVPRRFAFPACQCSQFIPEDGPGSEVFTLR